MDRPPLEVVETPEPRASESAQAKYLRDGIRQLLRLLDHELGHYCQTSHGSLNKDGTIGSVAAALTTAYAQPTSFNVSELSQCIGAFLAAAKK